MSLHKLSKKQQSASSLVSLIQQSESSRIHTHNTNAYKENLSSNLNATKQNLKDLTNILRNNNKPPMGGQANNCEVQKLVNGIYEFMNEMIKTLNEESKHLIMRKINWTEIQKDKDPFNLLSQQKIIFYFINEQKNDTEIKLLKLEENDQSEYEGMVQRLEAEIRQHIAIEQQMKLYAENIQTQLEEVQRENTKKSQEYIEKISLLEQEIANQKFLLQKELAKKNLCIQQLETKLKSVDTDSTKSITTTTGKHPTSANSGMAKKAGPDYNYNTQLNYMKAMHQKKDLLYGNANFSKDKDSSLVFNKTFSVLNNQTNLNCTQQLINHNQQQQQQQTEQLNTVQDQSNMDIQNKSLWKAPINDETVIQQPDLQQNNIPKQQQDQDKTKHYELLSKYFSQRSSQQQSQLQTKQTEENSQYMIVDRKQKYQPQYQKIPKSKVNWHQKQVSMIQRSQYLPDQNSTYRLGNTNNEAEQQSCYSKIYEQYQQSQQQQTDDNKKKLHQIVQHVDRNHQNITQQKNQKDQLESSINQKAISQSFRSSSVDANTKKTRVTKQKNDGNQALANLIMNKTIQQLNQSQSNQNHQNSTLQQQQQQQQQKKLKMLSGIPSGQLNSSSGFKKN